MVTWTVSECHILGGHLVSLFAKRSLPGWCKSVEVSDAMVLICHDDIWVL